MKKKYDIIKKYVSEIKDTIFWEANSTKLEDGYFGDYPETICWNSVFCSKWTGLEIISALAVLETTCWNVAWKNGTVDYNGMFLPTTEEVMANITSVINRLKKFVDDTSTTVEFYTQQMWYSDGEHHEAPSADPICRFDAETCEEVVKSLKSVLSLF